jgi:hypothetical protein
VNLSTCGRCGATIEHRPSGWWHLLPITDPRRGTHRAEPDDGHAATAEEEQEREPCPACHHVHDTDDEEEECGAEVGTGLYGSDGVEVTRWCLCTGPAEPATPEAVAAVTPDPWTDPDAAALASPPPF